MGSGSLRFEWLRLWLLAAVRCGCWLLAVGLWLSIWLGVGLAVGSWVAIGLWACGCCRSTWCWVVTVVDLVSLCWVGYWLFVVAKGLPMF